MMAKRDITMLDDQEGSSTVGVSARHICRDPHG
jgi:hypothetical protein